MRGDTGGLSLIEIGHHPYALHEDLGAPFMNAIDDFLDRGDIIAMIAADEPAWGYERGRHHLAAGDAKEPGATFRPSLEIAGLLVRPDG